MLIKGASDQMHMMAIVSQIGKQRVIYYSTTSTGEASIHRPLDCILWIKLVNISH